MKRLCAPGIEWRIEIAKVDARRFHRLQNMEAVVTMERGAEVGCVSHRVDSDHDRGAARRSDH